jgi:hypothetical protein
MPTLLKPRDPYRASDCEFLAFIITYLDLLQACWLAEEQRLPPPPGAVSWTHLRKEGVPESCVISLLYQNHVEHLKPGGVAEESAGRLVPAGSLLLTEQSRFALTEQGRSFADHFLAEVLCPENVSLDLAWNQLVLGRFTPSYDAERRLFVWGHYLLKCFRQPSPNQETILRAAEEMDWPDWFNDPLPRAPGMSPKVRLHDTIKWLNHRQTQYLIHFKGDGSGRRLGWEYR